MTNKNEPYWARYVASWRKPKPRKPISVGYSVELKHCLGCTRICEYLGYSEHDKRKYCPFYDLQ